MKTKQFIDTLHQLEDKGQVDPIVALFADNAEIWNPELPHPLKGKDGARRFWCDYKGTFAKIHSEICSTIEQQNRVALEWESKGVLEAQHQPICYRGVSIIDWADGHVCRFAAYFDARALFETKPRVAPVEQTQAHGKGKAQGQGS